METYTTEVWHKRALVFSIEDVPDSILQSSSSYVSPALFSWYKDISLTKKWQLFCGSLDEGRFQSGALTHSDHTIRVTKRKTNDNV